MKTADLPGFQYHKEYLGTKAQRALLDEIRLILEEAPLYVPHMPRTGKALSVRMSNCGPFGWMSDKEGGYRYQAHHPKTLRRWPKMPDAVLQIWQALAGYPHPPEACLINFYGDGAKMGMHRDADEADALAPVVSVSLGDEATYRLGGLTRKAPTRAMRLSSGDVVVLGGKARFAYHGIDRIFPGSSTLLNQGGRLNLTLRRVSKPED